MLLIDQKSTKMKSIQMLKKLLISACLASTLTLAACSTTTSTVHTAENVAALQQKNWVLSHIGDVEFKVDASAHNAPSLNFNNQALTGADGCNRLMGGYAVKGNQLSFSQLATTQMACLNTTDMTSRFNTAMNNVVYFDVSDTTLKLLDKDKKVLLQFKSN